MYDQLTKDFDMCHYENYVQSEMCIGRDSPLEPFVLQAPGLP